MGDETDRVFEVSEWNLPFTAGFHGGAGNGGPRITVTEALNGTPLGNPRTV
eukprot:COSAG06_NODE_1921_length_8062_cov_113.020846_8_plen_51_part_00